MIHKAPQSGFHLEQAPQQLLRTQRRLAHGSFFCFSGDLQPPGPTEEAVTQQHGVVVHGPEHGDVRDLALKGSQSL